MECFARTRVARPKTPYQPSLCQRSLIDLSLGSSDLSPPVEVLEAMASAIDQPASAGPPRRAGTAPFTPGSGRLVWTAVRCLGGS